MKTFRQSPVDPGFVQDPYPAYEKARALGDIVFWEEYGMPVATTHAAVDRLLRDPRFGRERPNDRRVAPQAHLAAFHAVEDLSLLELEGERHARLRGLVLRAFTSRRIAGMEAEIAALAGDLIDGFPDDPFDLLPAFARPLPAIVIARLLGVPDAAAPRLLDWSNAMVAMYQARRGREVEQAASDAAAEFSAYLAGVIEGRRASPGDDLISELIAARDGTGRLSQEEMIATCILLLNAGHEATVHTIGNAVLALHAEGSPPVTDAVIEEVLRFDPPLHLFTRWAYEESEIAGVQIPRGTQVGLLLASAGRDAQRFPAPDRFDPDRAANRHLAFGGGRHFCLGAPLARLELRVALGMLRDRLPRLKIVEVPRFAGIYHFHGLERLIVRAG
ncbi:cytochrome P450 [Palleronia aestuarii]|uniref:Cytochrome P450 n=1 Tax=Palleronia aestuarii TaxID=568105 RepID=A0A2W7ND87_9RHOB|nr:cytochrome P450 [Palleronia aestuarii]PZX18345.1 cytochrome P450 [Palleronia aestuarii]